jgi:hypothetical protein
MGCSRAVEGRGFNDRDAGLIQQLDVLSGFAGQAAAAEPQPDVCRTPFAVDIADRTLAMQFGRSVNSLNTC